MLPQLRLPAELLTIVFMLNSRIVVPLSISICFMLILPTNLIAQHPVTTEPEASMTVLFASTGYRSPLKSMLPGIGGYTTYMFGSRMGTRLDVGVQLPASYVTFNVLLGIHYWLADYTRSTIAGSVAVENEPKRLSAPSILKPYLHAGLGIAFQTNRNDIGQVQTNNPATSGVFDTRSTAAIAYRLAFGVQYASFDVGVFGGYSPISQHGYLLGLQVGYKIFEVKGD